MRLYIEVDGDGPTVVLAHGFAGSARNLGPQARALRDRYRVVRYDARGHARSEAPDDPRAYSLGALAADMGRVMDEVGAREAVVGGVSMGAVTALAFAGAEPARVRGVVAAALPASPRSGRGLGSKAHAFADAIERWGLEAAGARFVWGPESGLDARWAQLVRQGFLEHAPHALAHGLRGVVAHWPEMDELAAPLAAAGIPLLVIAGATDAGAVASGRALADAVPGAELAVVPDADHLVNLEQPARFNEVLRAWLDRLPA
ncbi:MAG TPA: alpha/beta fold hydrolase [Candidatus Limnocylindria bacterium]|nr:alpha/beta fold hydrolase [Candidatus Limnocylindria bacterium]